MCINIEKIWEFMYTINVNVFYSKRLSVLLKQNYVYLSKGGEYAKKYK